MKEVMAIIWKSPDEILANVDSCAKNKQCNNCLGSPWCHGVDSKHCTVLPQSKITYIITKRVKLWLDNRQPSVNERIDELIDNCIDENVD